MLKRAALVLLVFGLFILNSAHASRPFATINVTPLVRGDVAHIIEGRGSEQESLGSIVAILGCSGDECEVTYNFAPGADGYPIIPENPSYTLKMARIRLIRAVPLRYYTVLAEMDTRQFRDSEEYGKIVKNSTDSWLYSYTMRDWIIEQSRFDRLDERGHRKTMRTYRCQFQGRETTESCVLPIDEVYISLFHRNFRCGTNNYRSWGANFTFLLATPEKHENGFTKYVRHIANAYHMSPAETQRVLAEYDDGEIYVNNDVLSAEAEGEYCGE